MNLKLELHPESLFDAPYEEHTIDVSGYRADPAAALRAQNVGDGILRLRFQTGASVTEQLGLLAIPASNGQGSGLRLVAGADGFRVTDDAGNLLVQNIGGVRFGSEPGEFSGRRFLANFSLGADEHVFGFGGRVRPPDRRGGSCDVFAMKVGKLTGDYGGFPLPWFISTRGYGVFLNNPWPHVYFDMGKTQADQWFVHAPGGEFDMFVVRGPQFADIVRRFTTLVGRVPFPRKWWFGFWVSALSFSSTKEVIGVARRLRSEGYPADAIVLDGPWRGGPEFLKKYMADGEYPTNDLNWHPDFGDGPAMVNELRRLGIQTVLHQNSRSFLAATNERGEREGFLRRCGREVVVTFGTPAGEKFYEEQITPRFREGLGLWWLDHGDRVSGELLPGIPSRNLFGAIWGNATRRLAGKHAGAEQLVLIRGAGIGGQRCALPWPGDTRFGVDYFEHDIWFCLNAGLSGFPITSYDLGGFLGAGDTGHNRAFDEDNIARRLCQSIFFLPVPRVHADDSHPPKLPWNCPAETQQLYRDMLKLRYRLTPYFYSYAIQAHRTGDPILRPLVYHHQDDPTSYGIGDEFYVGDWLLVAPVTGKSQTSRKVYLPAGEWICYWTERRFTGPTTIEVETPLYEMRGLPVFVKAGAILPTQPAADFLTDDIPQSLTLDVYGDDAGPFTVHESATVSHTFSCRQGKMQLPNATPSCRQYELRRHRADGVFVENVSVPPGS